jgi:hypothetical protein
VELSPVNVRDADEIERAVTAFARSSNGGLIVTASLDVRKLSMPFKDCFANKH